MRADSGLMPRVSLSLADGFAYSSRVRFRFCGFEAATNRFDLTRDGEPVPIEPKPLKLLLHLLSRAPDTVASEDLVQVLWPEEAVTANSLFRAARAARRALGEAGPDVIRTVRGRGYRIGVGVERLTEVEVGPASVDREDYVGRRGVLATIESDVRAALGGSPRVIFLSGEPGIGKTRTAEIVCASDLLCGAEVVWGRCFEGIQESPLRPWFDVFSRLVGARPPDALRELLGSDAAVLSPAFPAIANAGLELEPAAPLPPDQERLRFLDASARFLAAVARERPLAIVLDDLHNADPISLAVLEHVAREANECSLLLIGTFRSFGAGPNPALDRVVAEASRIPSAGSSFALEGLSEEETGELVARLTSHPIGHDAVGELHRRTSGNPLFVREMARSAGNGRITNLPASLIGMVRGRIASLREPSQAILEAASVLGREFDTQTLAATAHVSVEACLSALDEAFEAGLVTSGSEGAGWRFTHMVVGDAIYTRLAPGGRGRLHVAAARALEERAGEVPDRVVGLVARHFQRGLAAADPGEVASASIRAADQAEAAYSFEEAAEHLSAAMDALDRSARVTDRERHEILKRIVYLRRVVGSREKRLSAGARALAVARRLGAEEIAEIAVRMHDIKEWGFMSPPEVQAALDEAVSAVGERPSVVRAHLLALRAHVSAHADLESAQARAAEAVSIARRFRSDVLPETLDILHYLSAGPNRLDERETIAREIFDLGMSGAPGESAVISLVNTACDQIARGDAPGAARWRRRAGELAGPAALPGMRWYLSVYDSGLALMMGDLEAAERLSIEAVEIGGRIDQAMATINRAAQVMSMAWVVGEPEKAADAVELALANAFEPVETEPEDLYLRSHGACYSAACDRRSRAAELLDQCSRGGFARIPHSRYWQGTVANLAHACADLGDEAHAAELEAVIAPMEYLHAVVQGPMLYNGSLAGARGRLLETLGRSEEAAAAFERAARSERGIGALRNAAESERRMAAVRTRIPPLRVVATGSDGR